MSHKLILASSSPARATLLAQINIIPDLIIPADIDETPKAKEKPFALVKRLAKEKAETIAKKHQGFYILAADTVIVRGTSVLGKPASLEEANKFLHLLSGRNHVAVTGVCVIDPNHKKIIKAISTKVTFKQLSALEIKALTKGETWQNKAGGYSLQGLAGAFATKIVGSYSNVLGLPLHTTYNLLQGLGYKVYG